MPNVNGKKFPYTPAGMAAAKKAAAKNTGSGVKRPGKTMTPSQTYSLLKKKTAKKPGMGRGK